MKNFYTLLFITLLLFSNSNVLAQTGPCSLSGASNYIDFTSSPTIMMNVSVNGMSQYSYGWNDGTPVGSSNQKPFYSGWCVTITDLMTFCDTTICESCIPTPGTGICTMINDPVCGCDGNTYSNDCIAMNNGIFTYTSTLGGTLPCTVPLPSWNCVNGACIDPNTGLGQYPSASACLMACMPPVPSWDCVNGACIDPLTGNGQYPNLNDCLLDSCIVIPPVPSWDCVNGACLDPLTGNGQYPNLNDCLLDSCIVTPPVPSWDCIGNICVDPGTGTGVYSDSLVCVAACIVNAVEEQNISKRLLKVIDFLGREEKGGKNEVLFYIYDDGTVEKKIVIE